MGTEDGAQFVLKITSVERGRAVNLNFPDSEAKMYKIMNKLVEKDISPHMFLGIETLKNIKLPGKHKSIRQAYGNFYFVRGTFFYFLKS